MTFNDRHLASYKAAYNALDDDVEAVYARFERDPDHDNIIRDAVRIIKEHGADEFLAISLLHRHFEAKAGEVFVEQKYRPEPKHETVLVTTAQTVGTFAKPIFPHRFQLRPGGRLQELEYTTDPSIKWACEKLQSMPELVKELYRFLKRKGLADALGVGIYIRRGIAKTAPRVFLEETQFPTRESIVHVLPHLPPAVGRAIPTLWTFGDNIVGCCRGQCIAYCSNHAVIGGGYCGHRRSGAHMICV